MSDITHQPDAPEDDLLAAEYALGVLSGEERSAIEQRIRREPTFALLVEAWEQRLAPWAEDIDAAAVSPAIWERLAARLSNKPTANAGWWQSLAFWRALTAATAALAAACVGALILVNTTLRQLPLVAAIDGAAGHAFVATVDERHRTIAVLPAAFVADPTRVPELWLIPSDGKPRALGLLQADHAVTIPIPADLAVLITRESVLAVSLEPPGGSPSSSPTGPVIGQGALTNL
jgi:anti-sigma-K factor RskA